MPAINDLNEAELITLYLESMRHCAQCVLDNVEGSDDSQDYTEAAVGIMSTLNTAYRADEPDTALREAFNTIVPNAWDLFASDAVPAAWAPYIQD